MLTRSYFAALAPEPASGAEPGGRFGVIIGNEAVHHLPRVDKDRFDSESTTWYFCN